jgi:hypothetical protein
MQSYAYKKENNLNIWEFGILWVKNKGLNG